MRKDRELINAINSSLTPFMQKIILILVAVLSLATAALGYLNRGKILAIQTDRDTCKQQVDKANKGLSAALADVKAKTEKLALVGSDQEKLASENTDLKSQLAKKDSAIADAQKQSSDKDATINQQKSDMAAKDAHIADLESKVNATSKPAASNSDELKKQLEEKDVLTTSLQTRLKEQEAQLAVLKDNEKKRQSKQMRKGLTGRILAVNPSWNFVVLSLGDRNGVVNNAEMLINRGNQLIGKVRITSVEPSTSIADIVVNSLKTGMSVQPGDTVIYSGPGDDSQDTKTNP